MTTQSVPKIRLLTLGSDQIHGLLQRQDIVREFPFMQGMAAKVAEQGRKCGPCQKKRTNHLDYEGVKTAIGQMDPMMKQKLKQLLNAEQIRVVYRNIRGQVVKSTF